ncbi:MAG TPA: 3-deoxy-8-phosphooctulonate synthase [Syntrophales bacterium]|nr:3-deoxy-8-phosphooctulonate synthase [Syntrophales bacterium]HOX94486.1 3-deoxy-8-phosphooctulonate synthase [Syntrophales bacterium]HPI55836.1 3-deoxy-8-phosphooctulonate synthase [Syntrophales bacterium]HPN23673.1 3-deoxy-8-phosphooctulonate synthase [Syntrophales bacterium]HQM27802.1 3-deoxy-8-phosphooctulonate synthase [Syntrophales bacterium]
MKKIRIGKAAMGGGEPFVLIAGPCVIEDEGRTMEIARQLKKMTDELGIFFIFKASYDKANRTSLDAYRGPGFGKGLEILKKVKERIGIPVLSDVHRFEEIGEAAAVLDVVQVPAFLCRQTDFIIEVARKAKVVNVKKGQFLAPWDMSHIIRKVVSTGNDNLLITERGTTFGYNNLVSDFRSLSILRSLGYPVAYDATHSVQLPGGAGDASGGEREMVPGLSRAAVAVGVDALFMEVHPRPEEALCDGPNSLELGALPELLRVLKAIDGIVKGGMKA